MTDVMELFEAASKTMEELQRALEAEPPLSRTDAAKISNLEFMAGAIHRKAFRLYKMKLEQTK